MKKLLCFLFGHKWKVIDKFKTTTRVDGLLHLHECTFLECTRCGKTNLRKREIYHEVR